MKKSWLVVVGAAVVVVGGVAFMGAYPGTDWSRFEDASTIRAEAKPEEAYPGVSVAADRIGGLEGRGVVIDVPCPDGPEAMDCAAGAARAAAIWFSRHGAEWPGPSRAPGKVDWLLVNVSTPQADRVAGPSLIGRVEPASELETADTAAVLARFAWNGAGDLGDVPAAEWCLAHPDEEFCVAFRAEACPGAILKEPVVQRVCPKPE